jgi:hypothetical protein
VNQVAELIACCVSNPRLSKNKVLEAIAETTAPLRPIEELLSIIPSEDGEIESDATPVEDAQSIATTGQASKISRREEVHFFLSSHHFRYQEVTNLRC